MIHCSALPTRSQYILNVPLLQFQTLDRKTKSKTTAVGLTKPTFPEFNGNTSIDSQVDFCLTKRVDMIISLVPISLINLDSPTITMKTFYNWLIKRYLLRIKRNSLTITFILTSMTNYIKIKKTTCLNKRSSILNNYAVQILDAKYRQVNTNKVEANQNIHPGQIWNSIWWVSWCLSLLKCSLWIITWIETSIPLSIPGSSFWWTNIKKLQQMDNI